MTSRINLAAFCSLLASCSLAATLDGQGFVRDWLVSGPWPSYQVNDVGQGLDTDFLKPEDEVLPFPGKRESATFVADWGKLVAGVGSSNEWGYRTNTTFDASWTLLRAEKPIVSMDRRFAPIDDYFVVYAVCYVSSPREQPARIAVGSDDDHKVFLDLRQIGKVTTSQAILPGNFKYDVVLPKGISRLLFKLQDRTGECGFCVQLTDRQNAPLKDVEILTDVRGRKTTLDATLALRRSPAMLQKRYDAAGKTLAATQKALAAARAQGAALSTACAQAEATLRAAYALREKAYADEHAAAAAKGRVCAPAPFVPCARRSTLCLNGAWGSSVDGGKTWGRTHLPCSQLNDFFYSWTYPVKGGGRGAKAVPGFEDALDPVHNAPKATFRTTVDWDGASDLVLRCEAILGVTATVRVNGRDCGEADGLRGVVRVPLAGLVKGTNTLEIVTDRRRGDLGNGIRGDLWLEAVPKVRVDDVWIKTSWRKSTLRAATDLVNRSDAAVTATVAASAVKDGRVRFRLPERRVTVPAGGRVTVTAEDVWPDPETWGIGGAYGEPNLYTLVTDVRVGETLVDRHEAEFGFREFWICHTDFFLNGKRILLQGDVGHLHVSDKRRRDIAWPLFRAEGINIVRVHDSDSQWSLSAVRDADRMGMAMYAQMYPILPTGREAETAFAGWTKTENHRKNVTAYTRWWKDLRNRPSVLIWSTDNEILTQAWDTEAKAAYNVSRDRIGALYGDLMNALDPDLVVTRDGDVSTWNHQARWYQNPPCDTANYHYPNYNNAAWAENWQTTYEFRPVVFGEAIYCAYFNNGWVGARPKLVKGRVAEIERSAALYTRLDIPCTVYMGLALDGYIVLDETGKGNPWGLKESEVSKKSGWQRIPWPALSGEGERLPATSLSLSAWGSANMNFYEEGVPSHVRNAVNDAYRKALRPQPPVDAGRFAEVVVTAAPGASVWTATPAGNRTGVRADGAGRAWFRSLAPGRRTFTDGRKAKTVDLGTRSADVAKPGFVNLPRVEL